MRWQNWQWHISTSRKAPRTSKRTEPHRQLPVARGGVPASSAIGDLLWLVLTFAQIGPYNWNYGLIGACHARVHEASLATVGEGMAPTVGHSPVEQAGRRVARRYRVAPRSTAAAELRGAG